MCDEPPAPDPCKRFRTASTVLEIKLQAKYLEPRAHAEGRGGRPAPNCSSGFQDATNGGRDEEGVKERRGSRECRIRWSEGRRFLCGIPPLACSHACQDQVIDLRLEMKRFQAGRQSLLWQVDTFRIKDDDLHSNPRHAQRAGGRTWAREPPARFAHPFRPSCEGAAARGRT